MRFAPTTLPGVLTIELDRHEDERGGFARIYCAGELQAAGIAPGVAQASLSWNTARGTLRGMHFQAAPHGEGKTVRAVAGAIFDVAVDLRPGSATYARWYGTELSADNGRALYIPAGCAHGFLTLTPGAVVHYLIDTPYVPEAARGVRWDDPTLAIAWPFSPEHMSERDRNLPELPR